MSWKSKEPAYLAVIQIGPGGLGKVINYFPDTPSNLERAREVVCENARRSPGASILAVRVLHSASLSVIDEREFVEGWTLERDGH